MFRVFVLTCPCDRLTLANIVTLVPDPRLPTSTVALLLLKLKVAEIGENFDVSKMKKIVAGKKLWNYDNLEPTEKKGAI